MFDDLWRKLINNCDTMASFGASGKNKKWEEIKNIERNNWIWLEGVLKKGNKMKHMEKYG